MTPKNVVTGTFCYTAPMENEHIDGVVGALEQVLAEDD